MQRSRIFTQQNREAVQPFIEIPFEHRNRRFGVSDVGLGLGHIERRDQSRVKAVLGQLERVLLGLDVGVRDPQSFL